jgi:sigma-B regulation protein RsbU (phosphoserine phosphatase)
MANLQAHLRSFSGLTRSGTERMTAADLVRALEQVNRMVWKSTAAQHYATLFFGLYDAAPRRLTYANCGHNPPLLLRVDGTINHFKSTAMVIGLFEKWDCGTREIQLQPGDLLVIFSDGVTEAMRGEEEFGEARFIENLRRSRELPVEQIVTSIFKAVQEFSQGNQSDDLTLVVARVK